MKQKYSCIFFFLVSLSLRFYIHDKIVLCREEMEVKSNQEKPRSGSFSPAQIGRWIPLFLEELMVWEFIQGLFSILPTSVSIRNSLACLKVSFPSPENPGVDNVFPLSREKGGSRIIVDTFLYNYLPITFSPTPPPPTPPPEAIFFKPTYNAIS